MTIGLTVGKFLPLHKGHELLIRTAYFSSDTLYVLVGTTPEDMFPFEQRKRWIHGIAPGAVVINQPELDANAEKDEHGTIVDEQYWKDWTDDTRRRLKYKDFHYVYTSDKYGERIAKEFGATWISIDTDRKIIPISGTKIRENLWGNFHYLADSVKKDLTKVVAIIGPESTGKSILVENLARDFNTLGMPEIGRNISVPKENNMSVQDFVQIYKGQEAFINFARNNATQPVVFTDTEALVTALYADVWFPKRNNSDFYTNALLQDIDLYCVMYPNVKWVQDGFRVQSNDADRYQFHYKLIKHLDKMDKKYVVIDDSSYLFRETMVKKHVRNLPFGKT